MYNSPYPTQADLPSTQRLVRSTIIAAVSACAILVTVVLPSEYGIDVTGLGRLTGLTAMGEIKMQLAEEAAANQALSAAVANGTAIPQAAPPSPDAARLTTRLAAVEAAVQQLQLRQAALFEPATPLAVPTPLAPTTPVVSPPADTPAGWRDEVVFTLTPGQGTEYKLAMEAGAVAEFEFKVEGGVINYDQHGEGGGQSLSYEQVRGVDERTGQIVPPITGTHGWFFRNRGTTDVVVTLRTGGTYTELRKIS